MLSVNLQNNIINDPFSISTDLFNKIKSMFKNYIIEKEAKNKSNNIHKELLEVKKEVYILNEEVKTIRDTIDNYNINDIIEEEKIFNGISEKLDNYTDTLNNILDEIENKKIESSLANAIDELYSTVVNTNFTISHKITQAYFDNKSKTRLLQEA